MGLQPGGRFGRYELVSRLGRGGMAETYRARLMGAAGVTKPVLIKKVLPEFANDEAFTSMFISEARISATLSHGNVAQVYDFGRVDGEYFLAMEFVDGQPLHRIIKRALKSGLTSLPVPLATFTALEMCRGLHYAHTRTDSSGKPLGIVHRDISPDNVLVSYEGQVKIVDFGIAKARELRGFDTEPGIVKGKYLFFSPEQARGEQVDARTDVWATGIVLYEMLCGQLPVKGPHLTALPRLVNGEFPLPRELNPALPAELEDIVMSALALNREERIESCDALGDALAGFLYSTTPRFSALWLSHFVQELFREDLRAQGRAVQVPDSFLDLLAQWRGEESPTIPTHSMVAVEPRPATPAVAPKALVTPPPPRPPDTRPVAAVSATTPETPSLSPRSAMFWGVGAGALVTVIVTALVLSTMEEPAPSTQADLSAPQPLQRTPAGAGPRNGAAPPTTPTPAPGSVDDRGPQPPAPSPITRPPETPGPPPPPSRDASNAKALQARAEIYLRDQRFTQAADLSTMCLELDPRNAECLRLGGAALAELGRTTEAAEKYRSFLRIAPDHTRASEVQQALKQLEEAPAPAPPPPQPLITPPTAPKPSEQAQAAFNDATALFKAKQFREALTLATKCIELDPSHAQCHLVAGTSRAGLSEFEKAAEHYRAFLRLAPDHRLAPKVRESLEAYERQGRP
jgi:Tfp pilus assembly protein PilF/tRNA A-37 threonylcarbamoyl transferase component Bud32